jgi:hypothetical protein
MWAYQRIISDASHISLGIKRKINTVVYSSILAISLHRHKNTSFLPCNAVIKNLQMNFFLEQCSFKINILLS